MSDPNVQERRGADTANCETVPLPPISFAKLEVARRREVDPTAPIHSLGRFACLVHIERTGQNPTANEAVALRANDDLAIAAMFKVEHPGVYGQVVDILHQLDLVSEPATSELPTV